MTPFGGASELVHVAELLERGEPVSADNLSRVIAGAGDTVERLDHVGELGGLLTELRTAHPAFRHLSQLLREAAEQLRELVRRHPPEWEVPEREATMHPSCEAILKFFEYEHLPEHLQEISKPIGELARDMAQKLPQGAELTTGLRKLLEAKDCLVRAKLAG